MNIKFLAVLLLTFSVVSTTSFAKENYEDPCKIVCQGEIGPQGEPGPVGPQGPAGEDGQDGTNGTDGQDGNDGADGVDGQDGKDGAIIYESLSSDRGLAALQTRTAEAGQWTGALGFSGTDDGVDSFSTGVRYGFTDYLDGYFVVSKGFEDDSISWGTGITFILGGPSEPFTGFVRPEGCLDKLGNITGC